MRQVGLSFSALPLKPVGEQSFSALPLRQGEYPEGGRGWMNP